MNDLIDAIRALCSGGRARNPGPGADMGADLGADLGLIERALDTLGPPRDHEADRLSVVDAHLPRAVELARDPLTRPLAEAILARTATVPWRRSFSYDDAPSMKGFLEGYAVACLAGPDIPGFRCGCRSETVTFGLTLQAPHLDYPAHAHKAVELYCVIGGAADWQQGERDWRQLSSGDFTRHGPHEPHAMRTGEDPLLAFFAWVSDLDSRVYLVEP